MDSIKDRLRRSALGLVVVALLATLTAACSPNQPEVDKVGLYYTTGWLEGRHFQEVVEPGSGTRWTFNDVIYWLPLNQRNYIVSKHAEEGDRKTEDFIRVPAKGGIAMDFEVSVYFKLNTRTDDIEQFPGGTLRRFFEQICKKYDCTSDDGWDKMLNDNFRKIIETAMRQKVFEYTVDELFANAEGEKSGKADATLKIQAEIASSIKDNVNTVLGGPYFCGPTFDRNKPDCPDFQFIINSAEPQSEEVRKSFDAQRIALNGVVTARNNADAKKAEAEGIQRAQQASQASLTPEYLRLLEVQAMQTCAARPDCTLVITNGGTNVNVNAKK